VVRQVPGTGRIFTAIETDIIVPVKFCQVRREFILTVNPSILCPLGCQTILPQRDPNKGLLVRFAGFKKINFL
jgi:hypothetical protein